MIVFDASSLILLARTELLEPFLSSYPGPKAIPIKVRDEVLAEKRDETPSLIKLIETKEVLVLRVKNAPLSRKLMEDFRIDWGEADALALALQEKDSLVATDDRNAIRACKLLKLDFTTAIAILVRSAEKGLLAKEEAFLKLERLASIGRYKATIIGDARKGIAGAF